MTVLSALLVLSGAIACVHRGTSAREAGGTAALRSASSFPDNAALLKMIAARVDEGRATGIVLGVIDADGSTRIVSYGDAGPGAEPLGPDTVFKIGSTTKVFTSTLLAYEIIEGNAKLDDPAQLYAPDGLILPERNGRQITLGHLAQHTSGLPRDAPNRPVNAAGPSYAALTRQMLYDFLKSYPLPRDPAEAFKYSNLGSGLLGHVLSAEEGVDYDVLVHRRILDPLGMTRSGVKLTEEMQGALAIGHGPDGLVADRQLEENWRMPGLEGASDLYSTASDMLRFVEANLAPPNTTLKRAMRITQMPRVARPQGGMMGLDWNRYSTGAGPEIVFHSGAMPGYGSWVGFDPERRVGIVLLQNSAFAANDIAYHLLDPSSPLARPAEPRIEIDLPVEQLEKLAGVYAWDARPDADTFRVTVENGYLTTQTGNRPKEAIFPEAAATFFFRSSDSRIIFTSDDAGVATGLILRRDGKDETAHRIR